MVESYDSRTTILRKSQRRVGLHDLRIVSTLDGYIHDPLLLCERCDVICCGPVSVRLILGVKIKVKVGLTGSYIALVNLHGRRRTARFDNLRNGS